MMTALRLFNRRLRFRRIRCRYRCPLPTRIENNERAQHPGKSRCRAADDLRLVLQGYKDLAALTGLIHPGVFVDTKAQLLTKNESLNPQTAPANRRATPACWPKSSSASAPRPVCGPQGGQPGTGRVVPGYRSDEGFFRGAHRPGKTRTHWCEKLSGATTWSSWNVAKTRWNC